MVQYLYNVFAVHCFLLDLLLLLKQKIAANIFLLSAYEFVTDFSAPAIHVPRF